MQFEFFALLDPVQLPELVDSLSQIKNSIDPVLFTFLTLCTITCLLSWHGSKPRLKIAKGLKSGTLRINTLRSRSALPYRFLTLYLFRQGVLLLFSILEALHLSLCYTIALCFGLLLGSYLYPIAGAELLLVCGSAIIYFLWRLSPSYEFSRALKKGTYQLALQQVSRLSDFQKGVLHLHEGNLKAAKSHIEKSLLTECGYSESPEAHLCYFTRKRVVRHLVILARIAMRSRKLAHASHYLGCAAMLQPFSPSLYVTQAELLLSKGVCPRFMTRTLALLCLLRLAQPTKSQEFARVQSTLSWALALKGCHKLAQSLFALQPGGLPAHELALAYARRAYISALVADCSAAYFLQQAVYSDPQGFIGNLARRRIDFPHAVLPLR